MMRHVASTLLLLAATAHAAPDEEKLGAKRGYPVGTGANWFVDESVRVGSLSHQDEIRGIFHGAPNFLQPSSRPLPLPRAEREPDYRWNVNAQRDLSVADYLARQRITGLLIVKDGVVQVERYQYDRKPTHRMNSQSMAKSITALGIGIALHEGRIASLDDLAERYVPSLKGTVIGTTTIRNLLRMASGAKYAQTYDGTGDTPRWAKAIVAQGAELSLRYITEREVPQGTRFYYASPHSNALAAVLRGATGQNLSDYLTPRLWQAIGAESRASWYADRMGLEVGYGNFNATLRDYARLGIVLANDGVRPDDPTKRVIIPREFLLDATAAERVPEAFRPGRATPDLGYGFQFWIFPGTQRRFAMVGVFGQSIYVDPGNRLVMVQTGANATAEAGGTTLGKERAEFWRGVVRMYGRW